MWKRWVVLLVAFVCVVVVGLFGYCRTEVVYVDLMSGQLRTDTYVWGIPVHSEIESTNFSDIVVELSMDKSPPQWLWFADERSGG